MVRARKAQDSGSGLVGPRQEEATGQKEEGSARDAGFHAHHMASVQAQGWPWP